MSVITEQREPKRTAKIRNQTRSTRSQVTYATIVAISSQFHGCMSQREKEKKQSKDLIIFGV